MLFGVQLSLEITLSHFSRSSWSLGISWNDTPVSFRPLHDLQCGTQQYGIVQHSGRNQTSELGQPPFLFIGSAADNKNTTFRHVALKQANFLYDVTHLTKNLPESTKSWKKAHTGTAVSVSAALSKALWGHAPH